MKKDKHQHGHGKHMILMLLCCLIPIGLMVGIRYLNIGGKGLGKFSSLFLLLCPLMHLFMMKGMMGHGKGSCHEETGQDSEDDKLEGSNR